MKSQDKKLLIGGGIGIAALAYFTRRHTANQGRPERVAQHDHHKHGGEHKNERGEYGKHHHHEDQ